MNLDPSNNLSSPPQVHFTELQGTPMSRKLARIKAIRASQDPHKLEEKIRTLHQENMQNAMMMQQAIVELAEQAHAKIETFAAETEEINLDEITKTPQKECFEALAELRERQKQLSTIGASAMQRQQEGEQEEQQLKKKWEDYLQAQLANRRHPYEEDILIAGKGLSNAIGGVTDNRRDMRSHNRQTL